MLMLSAISGQWVIKNCWAIGQTRCATVQLNIKQKMLFVHIPRTGGSWFTYQWPYAERSDAFILNNKLGRHGKLSGILDKLGKLKDDVSDFKTVTIIREPL